MAYQILINSVDRTNDVLNQTVTISDSINEQIDTMEFSMMDLHSLGLPDGNDVVEVYLPNGTKQFGGLIVSKKTQQQGTGAIAASYSAVDYTKLLDGNLVHKAYEDMTDKEIIEDIIATYAASKGFTTVNVTEFATISQISFNYIQPSQALKKIAQLTGYSWYVDADKDVHYFSPSSNAAPFDITNSSSNFKGLNLKKDYTQIKNRIYVRGGTELSDFTTYAEKGDGEKTIFVLPEKPHEVTVTVNSVSKTLGIKNVDTSGYDWYLNYQEKYLEQDAGGTVLSTTDVLEVTYKYDIPILVAQEDATSIADNNGAYEFAIFDKTITTTDAARARAVAELTDYANSLVSGGFTTQTLGFRSGQTININHTGHDVNADYIVQKVTAVSDGGGSFTYQISLASAKTLGIIKFLISLLEANRNLIELDPNEVVDELFTVSDTISSPTESISDTVATPPFKWSNDAGTTINKMVWNNFQWS